MKVGLVCFNMILVPISVGAALYFLGISNGFLFYISLGAVALFSCLLVLTSRACANYER